jgi:glycosyltransferase involved in cell wall biosynthesis
LAFRLTEQTVHFGIHPSKSMLTRMEEATANEISSLAASNSPGKGEIAIAIDLTPLRSGGSNGGLRIAIFSLLERIRVLFPGQFKFLFLTATSTHDEIKSLQGARDETICLVDQGSVHGAKPVVAPRSSSHRRFRAFGVNAFYCPFGDIRRVPSHYGVIAWIADLLHRDYPQTLTAQEIAWREGYYRLLRNGTDAIQVNSRFTSERLSFSYGIDPSRIFVTYLAPRKFSADRKQENLKPYFLYPANYWVHKNHETLLVAYAHYLSQMPEGSFDLRLTGAPDQQMLRLQSLAVSLGLNGHVHFEGFLETQRFSELASGATALIFPSLYEGFGMPVTEAMLLGVPVIASRSGSLPEVGGHACHYIDATKPLEIAAAMECFTIDAAYRDKLSALGREQAQRFSLDQSAGLLGEKLIEVARRKPDLVFRRLTRSGEQRILQLRSMASNQVRRVKELLSGA